MLEKSVLIVAHPDDEILWFSSILDKVNEVIFCYCDVMSRPEWTAGRRKSISEYPKDNICSVGLQESEVFNFDNWRKPALGRYGIEISEKGASYTVYKRNYYKLKRYLADKLVNYRNVITHNPWGEYGHEEHVQIYKVVKELQEKLKFNLWFSNYCSNKSFNLMVKHIPDFDSEYITLKTDEMLWEEIKDIYKKNKCWTWYEDYKFLSQESFIKDITFHEQREKYGSVFPLNLIKVKVLVEPGKKEKKSETFIKAKLLIKKICKKAGFGITKYTGNRKDVNCISLKPENSREENVLLSYIIKPFMLEPSESIPNTHTHFWESFQIAQTFLDLGYSVDVISYRDSKFIPQKDYTFFVGARSNFQRIAELINKECIKIVHLDTAHWLFNSYAENKRSLELQQRKKVTLESFKSVRANLAIEHADFATVLGNQFTINTYSYAQKEISCLSVPTCNIYPWPEHKDFNGCRKSFFSFSSEGLVHKGLDLVLDAFSEMPDYKLTVCGPIAKEKDFENAYYKELYQTPNINTIGWIDIDGPEFLDVINNSIGLIYPSCAEGQSGAVVTCMQAGLIPILSYESGVDVDDFGLLLNDCSVNEIKKCIKKISDLPIEDLTSMSQKTWEYARANNTREKFAEEYRKFVERMIEIREN